MKHQRDIWNRKEQRPRPAPRSSIELIEPGNPGTNTIFTLTPGRLPLRPYQQEAFENRTHGIETWLWGRQTGKSHTLAAWAVDRLISRPGRLVTILSNSRSNGMELNHKCAEFCHQLQQMFEQEDLSPDMRFETMNLETRITIDGKVGRIKVLPANPRTARGFSGDLILDEFAFHENSFAIWEAVEPILAANPDYMCRVASTPNGRHNMFYRLATDPRIPLRKISRTTAWEQGCKIFHPITREEVTPAQARELAVDKRAYDQNYECEFDIENMALLTHELVNAAERPDVGHVWEQTWGPQLKDRGEGLFVGVDVGRKRDWTVMTVIERSLNSYFVRGILRMRDCRLPQQQEELAKMCCSHQVRRVHIDMTGLWLGLFEYTQQKYGSKIHGINFASTVWPGQLSGRLESPKEKVRVTEYLAIQLLQAFEDRQIRIPIDTLLREDLRMPERVTTPTGRVSIAATTGGETHADHFWSMALALNAAKEECVSIPIVEPVRRGHLQHISRHYVMM